MFHLKFFLKNAYPPVLLGLAGAILFNLAFPGGPFPWLAWIAMLPVMILLLKEKRPWAVCLGWTVYGIAFWAGATYWLYSYLTFVLNVTRSLTSLLMLICFIISAVPYIITGYIAARWSLLRGVFGAFKVAALLSALVAWWPVPFPGDLSMSFYRIPILTQIADIGGGHFIHFVIIWVNGLIAQAIFSLGQKRLVPNYIWMSLLGIFVFVFGYGYFRLNQYERHYKKAPTSDFVRIGYVQPNLPGSNLTPLFGEYMAAEEKLNSFMTSVETTHRLIEEGGRGLDLIAWPETPEDIPYNQFDWVRDEIDGVIRKARGAPFVFISMHPWSGLSDKLYVEGWNTLYLIKGGEVFHPYHKTKLIPFSEYLPGEQRFPILRKLFPLVANITAGNKMEYIQLGKKLRLIPLICYDGIFPNFVRKFAIQGGNLFLCLDNDTNFGPTKASAVHASVMLYRAIENRIPLIRLSNPRDSFTVLSSGQILAGSETKPYKKDFRIVTILPGEGGSIYQKGGYYFPFIVMAVFLVICFCEYLYRSLLPPFFRNKL